MSPFVRRLGVLAFILVAGCGRDSIFGTPSGPQDSLAIEPDGRSVFIGQTFQFDVLRTREGTSETVLADPDLVLSASDPAVLEVNAGSARALAPGSAQIRARLQGLNASAQVQVLDATLQSLRVGPRNPLEMAVGAQVQLAVTGVLSDGREVDLTAPSEGTEYLSNGDAVEVDGQGRVTARALGSGQVFVTNAGVQATLDVTVTEVPVEVEQIRVEPDPIRMTRNDQVATTVFGVTGDGSEIALPAEALQYSILGSDVVRVDEAGVVASQAQVGEAILRVQFRDQVVQVQVFVERDDVPVTALVTTPEDLELDPGESQSLRVVALFDNGAELDVTADPETSYASSDESVASVSNGGQVVGITQGQIQILVRYRGQIASVRVRVRASSPLVGLVIEPNPIALQVGQSVDLLALAQFANGSEVDVSTQVQLLSPVNGALELDTGVLTGVAEGGGQAVFEFQSAQASVPYAVLEDISSVALRIDADPIEVVEGEVASFTLFADIPGVGSVDITNFPGISYTSSNPMVFAAGPGEVEGVGSGRATLRASLVTGQQVQADVVVTGGSAFDRIVLSAPPAIPTNREFTVQVVGIRADGTGTVLNGDSNLRMSTDSDRLRVRIVGSDIRVSGSAAGSGTLSAVYQGLSDDQLITIGSSNPAVGLTVTPDRLVLAVTEVVEVTAVASLQNGVQVPARVQDGLFAVPGDSVVSVFPSGGNLQFQGEFEGSTTVDVFFQGLRFPLPVRVEGGATIVAIEVRVPSPLRLGDSGRVEVEGITSAMQRVDLTGDPNVQLLSTRPDVLRVVNGGYEAVAPGSALVQARFDGLTDATTVVVEGPRVPVLTALEPSAFAVRNQPLNILIRGQDLDPSDIFRADMTPLQVLPGGSSTEIRVRLPASVMSVVGTYAITAESPDGLSNALVFEVGELPSIQSAFPSVVVAGATTRVTVRGENLDSLSLSPAVGSASLVSGNGSEAVFDWSLPSNASNSASITLSNAFGPATLTRPVVSGMAMDLTVNPSPNPPRESGTVVVGDLTINRGGAIIGTGNAPLVFLVTGDARINGIIDVAGLSPTANNGRGGAAGPGGGGGGGPAGALGGTGSPSGGTGSSLSTTQGAGGGNGGGDQAGGGAPDSRGQLTQCGSGGGGGGGGGAGGDGGGANPGPGGSAGGTSDFGGGTGGGGGNSCPNRPRSGGGGGGGGVIEIQMVGGGSLTLGASAQLLAQGGEGGDGPIPNGGGGGGSGGTIRLLGFGSTIVISSGAELDARGGDGGFGFGVNRGGGGGGGRIVIDAGSGGSATVASGVSQVQGGTGINNGASGTVAISP